MRTCIKCAVSKPFTDFHANAKSKGGRKNTCAVCARQYAKNYADQRRESLREKSREYHHAHRDELLAKQRSYREANKTALNARQRARVSGLDDTLVALLLSAQNQRCAICLDPLELAKLHRDHCHKTGRSRGLLCNRCNTALGKFKDDPLVLKRAISYLANPPATKLERKT